MFHNLRQNILGTTLCHELLDSLQGLFLQILQHTVIHILIILMFWIRNMRFRENLSKVQSYQVKMPKTGFNLVFFF